MDTLIEFEAPREAPLPWVWWRAPHEAQKINFLDIILLFEATRPWGASWSHSNTKNEAHREELGCEAPHKYGWFCMILWGASYCAFLYKNQTRPKMRCLKNLKKWHHRDACLGITSLWGNFGSNCLSIIFGKRGASFLSLPTAFFLPALHTLQLSFQVAPLDVYSSHIFVHKKSDMPTSLDIFCLFDTNSMLPALVLSGCSITVATTCYLRNKNHWWDGY